MYTFKFDINQRVYWMNANNLICHDVIISRTLKETTYGGIKESYEFKNVAGSPSVERLYHSVPELMYAMLKKFVETTSVPYISANGYELSVGDRVVYLDDKMQDCEGTVKRLEQSNMVVIVNQNQQVINTCHSSLVTLKC